MPLLSKTFHMKSVLSPAWCLSPHPPNELNQAVPTPGPSPPHPFPAAGRRGCSHFTRALLPGCGGAVRPVQLLLSLSPPCYLVLAISALSRRCPCLLAPAGGQADSRMRQVSTRLSQTRGPDEAARRGQRGRILPLCKQEVYFCAYSKVNMVTVENVASSEK